MSAESEKYFAAQNKSAYIKRMLTAIKAVVFLGVFIVLFFLVREHYIDMIAAMGFEGYKLAFVHEYPLFSFLFYTNSATASACVNAYYNIMENGEMQWTTAYANGGNGNYSGGNGIGNILDVSDPRSSNQDTTIYGYMENGNSNSYDDAINALVNNGVIVNQNPTSGTSTLSEIFSYGLPLLNTALMLLSAIP